MKRGQCPQDIIEKASAHSADRPKFWSRPPTHKTIFYGPGGIWKCCLKTWLHLQAVSARGEPWGPISVHSRKKNETRKSTCKSVLEQIDLIWLPAANCPVKKDRNRIISLCRFRRKHDFALFLPMFSHVSMKTHFCIWSHLGPVLRDFVVGCYSCFGKIIL